MNALLSIKPEFAEKILAGEKEYEFRRTTFRDSAEIDLIYLYASSPVKQIVGLFTSGRIIEASPEELWELFGPKSGIDDRDRFMSYFEDADTGYAIEVNDAHRLQSRVDPNTAFEDFSPPMSFSYLSDAQERVLRRRVSTPIWKGTETTNLQRYNSD